MAPKIRSPPWKSTLSPFFTKPRNFSVFVHFVGMASDSVLIEIYIPQIAVILPIRIDYFRLQDKKGLPGVELLLDGI